MTKSLWTSKELLTATKGKIEIVDGKSKKDWFVTGVSIDTRTLIPGDLFVALKDKRDGHEYVEEAFKKGAAAAVIDKKLNKRFEMPLILVSNVMESFRYLAKAARKRSKGKFIAVTGSAGKTSTKEMLKVAFSKKYSVHVTEKNFNNELGVNLTLSNLYPDIDYVIIEIGMNSRGEISPLSKIVSPDVAIITSIGQSHLENLKNVKNIMNEKIDICDGLKKNGTCLIPGDFKFFKKLKKEMVKRKIKYKVFGLSPKCDYELTNHKIKLNSTIGVVRRNFSESFYIKIHSLGLHHLVNAMGVVAIFDILKLNSTEAILNISSWKSLSGRGKIDKIYFDNILQDKFFFLVDESYNSNPLSLNVALKTLSVIDNSNLEIPEKIKIRKVAILGDMMELGKKEKKIHEDLSRNIHIQKIDIFYCVGSLMYNFYKLLPDKKRGAWFQEVDKLNKNFMNLVQSGDIVMIKGSNSLGFNKLIEEIKLNKKS